MVDMQISNFAKAMAVFEARRAEELAYDRSTWEPAFRASNKSDGSAVFDQVDTEMDRLIGIRCDAEDVLIATSAPTLPAVIWKIEYARKRWEEMSAWPDEWWEAVMSDLHRVAATERY